MSYLLDSNVFIEGKNLYYAFDICPGFWEWLEIATANGTALSVAQVHDELRGGADELADWADNHPEMFMSMDAATVDSLRALSEWAESGAYEPAAANTFLQVADYYLVAYAHAHGHTVVTHEKPGGSTKKIKIPEACIGMDVPFTNTFGMLRAEQTTFALS